MNEVEFKVTVDEANLILEGLGKLPFAKVFALVAKVQEQANQQLGGSPSAEQPADAAAGAAVPEESSSGD